VNGKIALEEHFNLPEFNVPQYVSPEIMREISRRLLDVTTMRLAEMDAVGIDYSLQSLNAPGVQGEPDSRRAVARARRLFPGLPERDARQRLNPPTLWPSRRVVSRRPSAASRKPQATSDAVRFFGTYSARTAAASRYQP
jgi:2,3-dihydroxybenzoate decarboxylase